jgi:hypothetical protein
MQGLVALQLERADPSDLTITTGPDISMLAAAATPLP